MVAGAVKIYSWKNKNQAQQGIQELLILKIRQKKKFTIRLLENTLGYDRRKSYSENNLAKSQAENITKQAYYYLSKFLKQKYIKTTKKYEQQKGCKALMIYKLIYKENK